MTEIRCEFCGPTRIAPHDPNCPARQPAGVTVQGVPVFMTESGVWSANDLFPYLNSIRRTAEETARITVETNPEMFSPIVEKATDHYTVRGRHGAECHCGYNPYIDHREAGRGQLFAYVGQHIRNESGL